MEMKFEKFKKEERCKKLERSLKLALLRKSGKLTNSAQANLFLLPSSISSINTDAHDLSHTASFTTTFQTENEVISSSNNLQNIIAKKKNMYNLNSQMITSSSIKQASMKKNHFDNKRMALELWKSDMPYGQFEAKPKISKRDLLKNGDYSLSPVVNNSCSLQTKDTDVSGGVINSKARNARNNSNDNIDNSSFPKLVVSNNTNGHERTFFNWKVMLNEQGNLLVKGKLESGKVVHSKAIVRRLTTRSVQSIFKHIYHLDGNIVDNRNELPDYVRGKFYNGFPDDWENVHQIWLLYVSQGSKPNFHWPTKITDSDDDIKSEMTDCTLLCAKENQNKRSKLSILTKMQIPNNSNVELSPNDACSNDWKAHTSKAETTNASNSNTHLPDSRNLVMSSATVNVCDFEIENKENQHKHDNEKMHKIFFRKGNTMKDFIKHDKIDIIINNLLHKDCPKEYILKIIQMFDFLDDVLSVRIGTDETNGKSDENEEFPAVASRNDDKESGLHDDQVRDNKTEINSRSYVLERNNISPMKQYIHCNKNNKDVHKISSKILEKQSKDLHNVPEKENVMLVSRLETKDAIDSENETYSGVPRIISDNILKGADRYSLRRSKYKKKRKTTDVNLMTRSDVKPNKRFKEDRTRMYHSSSSDNDGEKERKGNKTKTSIPAQPFRENSANVRYDSSVSITEDEELQVEEKLDRAGQCKRKETDNLVYNRILNISSTEDEIELSKLKYKSMRKVMRHGSKEPKMVKAKDDTNDIEDTLDRRRENNIRSHLDAVKCNAFNKYCSKNANKRVMDVESTFLPTSSDEKEQNKDISKSKLDNQTCANNGQINRSENSPRVRQISKGYECQVETGKAREKDKSIDYKKVTEATNRDNKILGCMKDATINEFVSTDKRKLLCNWVPRIVYSTKSNSEADLVFEGKLLNEAGHVVHRKFVTERIQKRLSPVIVETANREFYQLVGDLHDPKHVVPKEIARHCRKGCPSDIDQFCKLWKSLQEGDASKKTSKEEDKTTTDILDVPISSRGRKKFPPLRYWNGERVTVKDDKIVYTAGNCRNFSMGSLTDNTNDRSILQEGNKLAVQLKTVQTMKTNIADEETPNLLKHTRSSARKARIEESKWNERSVNALEDDNIMHRALKYRIGKRIEKNMQNDIKCKKFQKTSRDNDATAQLDEHRNKHNTKQVSPVKMQNVKYLCYSNIAPADDILSDDQISQF